MSNIDNIKDGLMKIQKKDPIISTYNAINILKDPDNVYNTYSEHAATHMSLGNTSNYLSNLIKFTNDNRTCIVGAIVGSYGHGKTSTAIHLWKECEKQQIVAVPPFVWNSLEDIIKGTYGWLKYKLLKSSSELVAELDKLYDNYKDISYEKITSKTGISIEGLKTLDDDGNLKLRFTSEDVLEFIRESTEIAKKAKYKGLIVFTDELQVTLTKYKTPNDFYDDLFTIVNGLLNRKGNYGIIICMPTSTESHMAIVRRDIIDRLKDCKLYLRTNEIYDRDFPSTLWQKYSELYEFKEYEYKIVDKETLQSLGEISTRSDLGGGPRNVIDCFVQISNYYLKNEKTYTPINLIDDYLDGKISFDSSKKLVEIVKQELNSSIIKNNDNRVNIIKLLSAFPKGCPIETIKKYGLYSEFENIKIITLGETIQKLAEGYTLVKLLERDIPKEPMYVSLLRNFVMRYNGNDEYSKMAIKSFKAHILDNLFKVRRKDQIDGWIASWIQDSPEELSTKLIGTFNNEYPHRTLLLDINLKNKGIIKEQDELGLLIQLENQNTTEPGAILIDDNNTIILKLNLNRLYDADFHIPNEDLLPKNKFNPLFMLSLIQYIDSNNRNIPPNEKEGELKYFIERLETYTTELLFSEQLKNTSPVKLSLAGTQIIKDLFLHLCKVSYPNYKTLITSPKWEDILENRYIKAINDERIPLKVARGKRSFEINKDELANIFGIKSVLSLQTYIDDNFTNLLTYDKWGGKDDKININFKLHPFEKIICNKLYENNEFTINNKKCLSVDTLYKIGHYEGYLGEEVDACISLLESRRLICYNSDNNTIEEIIETTEDYKKKLYELLQSINDGVNALSIIKSFSSDKYKKDLLEIENQIDSVIDFEGYEELNSRLSKIIIELTSIKNVTESDNKAKLSKSKDVLYSITTSTIPSELREDKQANVSWVEDLNIARISLFKKYTTLISRMRTNIQAIKDITRKLDHETSLIEFKAMYPDIMKIINWADQDKAEYEKMKIYIKNYGEWDQVLKLSGNLFAEAINFEQIYNYSEFTKKLTVLFEEISRELNTRDIEALSDYELFLQKLNGYKLEIEEWNRSKRQNFAERKIKYEKSLNELGVQKSTLTTIFDIQDPNGSFQRMYSEILDEISKALQDLIIKLSRIENELLYVSKVNSENVESELTKLYSLKSKVSKLHNTFSIKMIEDESEWNNSVLSISQINKDYYELDNNIKGKRQKKELLTDKEKAILSLLNIDYTENDLEDIILKLMGSNGKSFEFKDLSENLINLFQKNQVLIKVSKRR